MAKQRGLARPGTAVQENLGGPASVFAAKPNALRDPADVDVLHRRDAFWFDIAESISELRCMDASSDEEN